MKTLTQDELVCFNKAGSKLADLLNHLSKLSETPPIDDESIKSCVSLIHHYSNDVIKIFDPDNNVLNNEKQSLVDHIKTLHQEIACLNQKVANSNDLDSIAPKLEQAENIFKKWLKSYGLKDSTSGINYKRDYKNNIFLEFKVYCWIETDASMFSDKPVTEKSEKENIINILKQNIDLFQEDNRNYGIEDTQKTKDFIKRIVKERFPNYNKIEFSSRLYTWLKREEEKFVIKDILISVPLTDIFNNENS